MSAAFEREFTVAGVRHGHILSAAREVAALGWRCIGVADDDPAMAQPLAAELGAEYSKDAAELAAKRPAPLLLCADINARKWLVVTAALAAGANVLVDKPLATGIEQLERIRTQATLSGKGVWVMFTLRYSGPMRALKDTVASGELGAIAAIEAVRPLRLKPKARPAWMFEPALYGGVLNDLACHDIDAYLWLTGAAPKWVKAEERTTRFMNLERGSITDTAVALMGGGAPYGYFRADWLTPAAYPQHGDCRTRIVGSAGAAELFHAGLPDAPGQPVLIVYSDSQPPRKVPAACAPQSLVHELAGHLAEGAPMALSSEESIRSSLLTLLAVQSARSGQLLAIPQGRL